MKAEGFKAMSEISEQNKAQNDQVTSGQVEPIVMRAEIRNIRDVNDEYDSYLVLLVGDKSYPYMHIPETMPDVILALALRKLNA